MPARPDSVSKEVQRIVSRAQRLTAATSKSPAILGWSHEDVDHMAEAASMLWDQAQSAALRDVSLKGELNGAISRIFEPLLMYSGQFKLSAQLAASRLRLVPPTLAELEQAHCFRLLMLALEFRFEDNFEWERQSTYDDALLSYQALCGLAPREPLSIALIALSMNYLGLLELGEVFAKQLAVIAPPQNEIDLNDAMPTPKFWRDTYASPMWRSWCAESAQED